jgi:hypothetical protein
MFAGTMAAVRRGCRRTRRRTEVRAAVPLAAEEGHPEEAPNGSMNYKFKLVGKDANIGFAPRSVATDDVRVTLEIESGGVGVCFESTLTTCVNKSPAKDACDP